MGRPFDLHLAGDGPLGAALKAFARGLKIGERIVWHGWCDRREVRRRYQEADCLVSTSPYEAMPNVILEAMACALPVVAPDVGGSAELVRHEQTGFLVNLNRPATLRHAVRRLIEDPRLAARMGRNSRQVVEAHYSWDRVAAAFLDVFNGPGSVRLDDNDGSP
jgi:glycosyltransferase involved in cell wall biosynthesis